jgi:hypothetical protein
MGGNKKEMRRINPETGKNFKQGDVCEDGKIFIHYELVLDKDGYYKERKKSLEGYEEYKKKIKNKDKRKREKIEETIIKIMVGDQTWLDNLPEKTKKNIEEIGIVEHRIPGRIQESVPNYQNWFERMKSGVQDKFSNFKMPPLGIMGLINAIGNQFEDRPLGTSNVVDEYGNIFDSASLDKQNALGGYYTDPARSSRRALARYNNMLERKALGKTYSKKNLAKMKEIQRKQRELDNAGYTGTPGGNIGSGAFAKFDQSGKTYGP